ncbi:hypothetical protein NKH82_08880 [Mesorhizobium sp. M0915]|nr:hypothetical protein [Mesorhizobium sp. LSHC420B00]
MTQKFQVLAQAWNRIAGAAIYAKNSTVTELPRCRQQAKRRQIKASL